MSTIHLTGDFIPVKLSFPFSSCGVFSLWDLFSLGFQQKSWGNSARLMGELGSKFGNLPVGRPGD